MRPTVGIAVIAKNESNNVRQWFESVKGLFDQYVFVDTGSTDDTVAIAKELGLEVYHFDWVNDFSAARNFAFSKLTTDYGFWNDLDDVMVGQENFLLFRDNVMKIADYWVAPYQYASHPDGTSACTFIRERVVKLDKGYKWKYFIHEGIQPDISGSNPAKCQAVNGWFIKHVRTDEDLKKDRSRNINIFEEKMHERPLDARERYYFGKELFEAQRFKEAIPALGSALTDPSLEIHDRILGTQYLASSYFATDQYIKSIEICHTGLMLDPNRAEFNCILGDCFMKMSDPVKAVPHYGAAKSCMRPNKNAPTPIYTNDTAYSDYPRNQLARLYVHMGALDTARKEVLESIKNTGSEESKAILFEIDKMLSLQGGYKNAQPCGDIVITTPPTTAYEFDPEIAKNKSMGGSETALIEMAYWLKKHSGRTVKVFNMRAMDGIFDGVEYISTNRTLEYMSKHKPFLHIAWRHNIKLTDAPTFVWSHDLFTPGGENHENYEKIMCLTPFHKGYMQNTQNVPAEKIWVTRNGIKPERFTDGPWKKDPWKFVFSSSPDRGLDRTIRVLDKVREKYPEIKLHIFYGISHLEKYGLGALQKQLQQMFDERKDWIIYHGATQQDQLMKEFKSAAYCVQPSDWIETSKITALEMACAGIYQITRAVGGCVDTLKPISDAKMATLVESECITELEYQKYIDATIEAIEQEAYKRVSVDPQPYAWELVAKEWLEYLPTVRGDSDGSTGRDHRRTGT